MKTIEKISKSLGPAYSIKIIDGEDVIYRQLDNGYEFEVSGIYGNITSCTLYIWKDEPRKLIGMYQSIPISDLKDFLGYFAVKYQNLFDKIQVEREEIKEL